jgi:small subunit ribosomal protein S5e
MSDDWDEEVETTNAAAAGGVVPVLAEMPEIKLFGKWSCDEVNVSDMSLQVNSKGSWLREPLLICSL